MRKTEAKFTRQTQLLTVVMEEMNVEVNHF